MSQPGGGHLLVQHLIAVLESVLVLLPCIEVDLKSGFLYRRRVRPRELHWVHRLIKVTIGRVAENFSDQAVDELRPSIIARRLWQFFKKRRAVSSNRGKHFRVFERYHQGAETSHRDALD